MSRNAMTAGALGLALLAACNKPAEKAGEAPAGPSAAAPNAAATPVMPERKPGLWNLTVSGAGMTQTFKICLDVATNKKLSITGGQTSDDVCKQTKMGRTPDGAWEFASSCDMGAAGHIETTGVATGDLTSKYQSKAVQVTTGAKDPAQNGTTQSAMSAEWVGPCPADFAPGDLELPGGQRMNLSAMGAQAN